MYQILSALERIENKIEYSVYRGSTGNSLFRFQLSFKFENGFTCVDCLRALVSRDGSTDMFTLDSKGFLSECFYELVHLYYQYTGEHLKATEFAKHLEPRVYMQIWISPHPNFKYDLKDQQQRKSLFTQLANIVAKKHAMELTEFRMHDEFEQVLYGEQFSMNLFEITCSK